MKQTKRKRNNTNSSNNLNKRKKLQDKSNTFLTINVNKSYFPRFEDLSNELIYEIFDYLDIYHVYQAFFDFNQRFKNLLIHSILPIKINIFSISKSNFEDYYLKIIKPNKHRITFLHLSNVFIIDNILSPPQIISQFIRLETLILDHIESKHLKTILQYSVSLPNLSSLTIHPIDYVENSNEIYHQIFRLPFLKSCKILGYTMNYAKISPNVNNQSSPIEFLVMENSLEFDKLNSLLSYLPQLHHFSIRTLSGVYSKIMEFPPMVFNYLTHLSMTFHEIYFIQFEKLIRNSFHYIQVLHITAGRDVTYVDANQWEQLILFHMLNLRVFDMNYECSIYCDELSCDVLTKNFNSSFWIERNSFFIYHKNSNGNINIKIFYSIDSSKKMNYRSFKIKDTNSCSFQERIIPNSVDHIYIYSKEALNNCKNYFPNIKNLTFDHNLDTIYHPFATNLNRIIPLLQIKKLVIECYNISFRQMIEILCFTPNLHTLKCPLSSVVDTQYTSIQQSESFIFVSNTNNIKCVSLTGRCGLKEGELVVALFPRLEHLKVGVNRKQLDSFIRFLFSKNNNNNTFFLCISMVPKLCLREIKKLIKSEKLLDSYMTKYIDRDLYLYW